MDNKCPKCGKKLSVFYIKETCSDCGCNLMYYNMESRLEEDHQKAEAEFQKLDEIIAKLKNLPSAIKAKLKKLFTKKKQGEQN